MNPELIAKYGQRFARIIPDNDEGFAETGLRRIANSAAEMHTTTWTQLGLGNGNLLMVPENVTPVDSITADNGTIVHVYTDL